MAAAALLFDLDGTLCDSRPWFRDVLVQECGVAPAVVEAALTAGRPPVLLAQDLGGSRTRLFRRCADRVAELRLYPGVRVTLNALIERRVPLALVTGQSPRFATLMLEALALQPFFRAVVAAERGMPPKPSPTSTLRALDLLDLRDRPGVIYVGDSARDAGAANGAGIGFAWAAWGYDGEPPPGITTVLQRFAQVLDL